MEKQRKRRTRTLALLLALGLIFSGTTTSPAASVGDSQAEEQNEAELVDAVDETTGTDAAEYSVTATDENTESEAAAGEADSARDDEANVENEAAEADGTETKDILVSTEDIEETDEKDLAELEADGISSSEIGIPHTCNPAPDVESTYEKVYLTNYSNNQYLSWNKVADADSYVVYRKGDKETEWTKLNDKCWVTDPYSSDDDYDEDREQVFVKVSVPAGDWYTFVCCAVVDGVEGSFDPDGFRICYLRPVTTGKSSMYNCSVGVKLEWNAIEGAAGYKLYRREVNVSSCMIVTDWKGIAWIRDGSRNSWVDKTAENGHEYEYAIRAYYTVDGKTRHAMLIDFKNAYTSTDYCLIYVERLTGVSAEAAGSNTVVLNWSYPADVTNLPDWSDRVQGLTPEITYCKDPDFQGEIYKVNPKAVFSDDPWQRFGQSELPTTAVVKMPEAGTYYFRLRNRYITFDDYQTLCFKGGRSDTLKVTVN